MDGDIADQYRALLLKYVETCGHRYDDDRISIIDQLRTICEQHSTRSTECTLYPMEISIDAVDLMNVDVTLGLLAINKHLEFQTIITEVIYNVLRSRQWLQPQLQNIGQLLVIVRIISVPPVTEFQIKSIDDLSNNKWKCASYHVFDGIIVSLSTPSEYTIGASYLCVRDACPGSIGNKFTRFHVPGAQEKQTVSDAFLCTFCGSKLRENVKARLLSEKIIAEMIPSKILSKHRPSYCQHAMTVYFRGSLVQDLNLGHRYLIIAIPICKWSRVDCQLGRKRYALEASSLVDITTNTKINYDDVKGVPSKIDQLMNKFQISDLCRRSQYISVPLFLAFMFADHIAPGGLFLKLKLGLLLSLVNCDKTLEKAKSSLLVISRDDTSVINRLLRYGLNFVERTFPLTVETQLKITCSRRNQVPTSGALFVDANPVLLASTGVCYLGDLTKFSNASKRTIANILDRKCVSLNFNSSMASQSNGVNSNVSLTSTYPLDCQFWGYIEPPNDKWNEETFTVIPKQQKEIPRYLLDSFGLVYYVDSGTASDNHLKEQLIVDYLLESAISNRLLEMSDNDFEIILQKANQVEVQLDASAELLIQDYFVASRRIRSSDRSDEQTTPLPLNAILALTCTAESLAKLSFRNVVTDKDAIMAIYLYEESVTARFGMSFLHVQPRPHSFGSDVRSQLIKILSDLDQFESLLRHHVTQYDDKSSVNRKHEE